jgi:hypothetical protein
MHVVEDSIRMEWKRLPLDRFTGTILFRENKQQEKRIRYPNLYYD